MTGCIPVKEKIVREVDSKLNVSIRSDLECSCYQVLPHSPSRSLSSGPDLEGSELQSQSFLLATMSSFSNPRQKLLKYAPPPTILIHSHMKI